MKIEDVFSETYAVLQSLGIDYISKIPFDVFSHIEAQRNRDYSPVIDENKALNEQGLSKSCLALLFNLKHDYMCNTEEERNELKNILKENDERFKESLDNEKSLLKRMKIIRDYESD